MKPSTPKTEFIAVLGQALCSKCSSNSTIITSSNISSILCTIFLYLWQLAVGLKNCFSLPINFLIVFFSFHFYFSFEKCSYRMVHVIAMEVLPEERDRKYYADSYSCCPPPLFILLITIIEVKIPYLIFIQWVSERRRLPLGNCLSLPLWMINVSLKFIELFWIKKISFLFEYINLLFHLLRLSNEIGIWNLWRESVKNYNKMMMNNIWTKKQLLYIRR